MVVKDVEKTYVCYVIAGEEDLGDGLVELVEEVIPEGDETALSDCCECLGLSEMVAGVGTY